MCWMDLNIQKKTIIRAATTTIKERRSKKNSKMTRKVCKMFEYNDRKKNCNKNETNEEEQLIQCYTTKIPKIPKKCRIQIQKRNKLKD